MTWLKGGPFYELSLLFKNPIDKIGFIENILEILRNSKLNFQIFESDKEFEDKLKNFIEGYKDDTVTIRILNLNTKIDIVGNRKFKLNVIELSEELIEVNFWFYGSLYDADEWEQKGIKVEDKPYFKRFLIGTINQLNPIIATIAYENSCDFVFDTEDTYPSSEYVIKDLSIEKIKEKIQSNDSFEYCWINGKEFGVVENIEIINRTF